MGTGTDELESRHGTPSAQLPDTFGQCHSPARTEPSSVFTLSHLCRPSNALRLQQTADACCWSVLCACRDPSVQRHLAKVYLTLCASVAACAAGCALGMQLGFLMALSQLAAFGCLLGLAFTSPIPANTVRDTARTVSIPKPVASLQQLRRLGSAGAAQDRACGTLFACASH